MEYPAHACKPINLSPSLGVPRNNIRSPAFHDRGGLGMMNRLIPPPTATDPAMHWGLAGLSLCMLLSSLGTSIANVALPTMTVAFEASFQQVQWVVLSYLLAITTLIVSAGRLGDIIGRRRLLLCGIALFTLASLLCGLASSLSLLIAGRALQGGGAAMMMALTMAFVGDAVPKARIGRAMGLLGTMSAVGTALGPSLGGALIAAIGWRSIFLINLPLGLMAMGLVYRALPADAPTPRDRRPRFDGAGTVVLALTLGAYALAMTMGRGTFGWINLTLVLAAMGGVGLFLLIEVRVASPLLPLAMFRDLRLDAGLVSNGLVSTVMMTTLIVGPFYLSRGLDLDAAAVGIVMSIGPVLSALSGVLVGRMVDRSGAARMVMIGLVAMAAGCLAFTLLPAVFGLVGYIIAMVVLTPGYQLFQAANNTTVMVAAGPNQKGVLSGMLNLSRNLGLVTGASAMGAVFAFAAATADLATAPADAVETGLKVTFAVAAVLVGAALTIVLASNTVHRRPS